MLVLNRNIGESIFIGDDIEVKILANEGRVSVGIQAPQQFRIIRSEISDRKKLKQPAKTHFNSIHG